MKVLLDENIPHDHRPLLQAHECYTVAYLGWKGTGNGRLLTLACDNLFDVLITIDRGYEFQHNQSSLPSAVIILRVSSNSMDDISPVVPKLLESLESLNPCSLVVIE